MASITKTQARARAKNIREKLEEQADQLDQIASDLEETISNLGDIDF